MQLTQKLLWVPVIGTDRIKWIRSGWQLKNNNTIAKHQS